MRPTAVQLLLPVLLPDERGGVAGRGAVGAGGAAAPAGRLQRGVRGGVVRALPRR